MQIDLVSGLIGGAIVIVAWVIYSVAKAILHRKKYTLEELKGKVKETHKMLQYANEHLSDLYKAFNDIENGSK